MGSLAQRFEPFEDVVDHTHRLGFLKMPPGYRLLQLDSGHFIYERISDEKESPIHWNKWVVRGWAWSDYLQSTPTHPQGGGEDG